MIASSFLKQHCKQIQWITFSWTEPFDELVPPPPLLSLKVFEVPKPSSLFWLKCIQYHYNKQHFKTSASYISVRLCVITVKRQGLRFLEKEDAHSLHADSVFFCMVRTSEPSVLAFDILPSMFIHRLLQSYIQSSLKDGQGGPEIATWEQGIWHPLLFTLFSLWWLTDVFHTSLVSFISEVFFLFGLYDYDRSGFLDGLEMMKLLSDYSSHHTPGTQASEPVSWSNCVCPHNLENSICVDEVYLDFRWCLW